MIKTILDRMKVSIPEGDAGDMRIRQFTIPNTPTVERMRFAMQGRSLPPGTYTRLTEGEETWMSDTPAERRDHYTAVAMIEDLKAKRVLINGLGIGMVLTAALSYDHVERVDVVERDQRVIDLVGPHYLKDDRVRIHHADAFDKARDGWAPGTRWDVGWSDIWPTICTDDLPEHAQLNRSYGRRCTWHGCWVHDVLVAHRRREQREEARHNEMWGV